MSRILHVQDTTTKRERCEQGVHGLIVIISNLHSTHTHVHGRHHRRRRHQIIMQRGVTSQSSHHIPNVAKQTFKNF